MAKLRQLLDQTKSLARDIYGVADPASTQVAPTSYRPELDTFNKYDANLIEGEEQLANRIRNQSAGKALGNAALRSIGELTLGTLEGFGYLADFPQHYDLIKGAETEFTNRFSEYFKGLQESLEEAAPVYYDQDFSISSFTDAKWWANSLPTLANSLSLLLPATAVAKGASLAGKGMRALSFYNKLPKSFRNAQQFNSLMKAAPGLSQAGEGIVGAVASRYMENTLEAVEKADAKYKELLEQGLSEEEARIEAGKVGRNVWYSNMPLVLTDFYQYQKIFRPFQAVGDIKNKGLKYALDLGKTAASEGLEEAIQFGIGEEAEGSKNFLETLSKINFSKYTDKPEFWESVALGAIGGAVFQGVPDAAKLASDKIKSFLAADTPLKQNIEAKKEIQEIVDKGEEERIRLLAEQEPDPEIQQRVNQDIDRAVALSESIPASDPARAEKIDNSNKQAAIEEELAKNELALQEIIPTYSVADYEQFLGEDVDTALDYQKYGKQYEIVDTQIQHIKDTLKRLTDTESLTYKQYESKLKELESQKEQLKKGKVKPVTDSKTPIVKKLAKEQVDLEVEQQVAQQEYKDLEKSPEKVLEEKKQKQLEQLETDLKSTDTPIQIQGLQDTFKNNPEASAIINKKIQKEVSRELKGIEQVEEIDPTNYPFTATFEPSKLQDLQNRLEPGKEPEVGETYTTPDNIVEVVSTIAGITKIQATDKKTSETTEVEVATEELNKVEEQPVEEPINTPVPETPEIYDETLDSVSYDNISWEGIVRDIEGTSPELRDALYKSPNAVPVPEILDVIRHFHKHFPNWKDIDVFFEVDKDLSFNEGQDVDSIVIHAVVYKGNKRIPIAALPSPKRIKSLQKSNQDPFKGNPVAEADYYAFRRYMYNKHNVSNKRVVQSDVPTRISDIYHGKWWAIKNQWKPIKEVLQDQPLILGVMVGDRMEVGVKKGTARYNELFGDKVIVEDTGFNPEHGVFALVQMPNGKWIWHKTNVITLKEYQAGRDRINEILNKARLASQEINGKSKQQIQQELQAGQLPDFKDWTENAVAYNSEMKSIVKFSVDRKGERKQEPDFNANLIYVRKYKGKDGVFSPILYKEALDEMAGIDIIDKMVQVSHTQLNQGDYNDVVADRIQSHLNPGTLFHSPSFRFSPLKTIADVSDVEDIIVTEQSPQTELDRQTEELGIQDRIQQSTVEGDNKVTVKWVTPDKKVFDKQRDAVDYVLGKKEETPETTQPVQETLKVETQPKFTQPVIDKYKGKIVYATPGSGKTYVAEGREDIVDGDTVLEEVIKEHGKWHPEVPLGLNLHYNRGKGIETIFQTKLRQLAEEGKTVLTGNMNAIDIADVHVIIPDAKSIIERTKNRSNPILLIGAKKIKELEESIGAVNLMLAVELGTNQYVSDILFQQQPLQNPLDGFNLGESFDIGNTEFKVYNGDFSKPVITRKEWRRVRKMLPKDVTLEAVDTIIKSGNVNAWGVSQKALVQLSKLAPYGTGYHEAFHQIFTYLLHPSEQTSLRKEAEKNGVKYKVLPEGGDTQTEWLADRFADYQIGIETASLATKIREFFKALVQWIKLALGYNSTVEGLFSLAGTGYFNIRSYNQTKNVVEHSKTNLTPIEDRDLAHISLNILDQLIQQFAEAGELDIATGYKKALNKRNPDKDLILSFKGKSVVTLILNQAVQGKTNVQRAIDIVKLFRPGFIGYSNGQPQFVPGTENVVGPAYDLVVRNLYTRGLDVSYNSSEFQSDEQFEYDESDDLRESWTRENLSISVKEKLTPKVRRFLYMIPNGKKDEVGLGFDMTYDGTEMYSILQKEIGQSTDIHHMVRKIGEAGKYHDFFANVYLKINKYTENEKQNQTATQLYNHLAQNQHPRNVTIYHKDGQPRLINSNRYTLITKLKNDFKDIDDSKKYEFSREEINSKDPSAAKAKSYLDSIGVNIPLDVIQKMKNNNELYEFLQTASRVKRNKYGKLDQNFDELVKMYSKYVIDPFQDSYLNVEGKRTYEWINNSFIGELIAGLNTNLTDIKQKYGEYAALPIFQASHNFEFVVVDGIKEEGEATGKKYSSFSDIDMWKTMFALAKQGIYTVPILSDSPNMVGVKMPSYQPHEVIGKIADVVRYDKHKSIFGIDPATDRTDIIAQIKAKTNSLVSKIKAEVRKYKLNEIRDENGRIVKKGISDTDIINFASNYMLNHAQLILITTGDPNFYGNPDKFFKRAKEIWSPGTHPSSSSFFTTSKGQRIQSPKHMNMRVETDVEEAGNSIEELKTVLSNIGRKDLAKEYEEVSTTDAQTYIDLISYRWREIGLGRWNHSKQAIFDLYEQGKTLQHTDVKDIRNAVKKDIEEAKKKGDTAEIERLEKLKIPTSDPFQPFKPFYYDLQLVNDILTPVQKKDSEFLILPIYGKEETPFYNPKYRSILEEMGYDFKTMSYKYTEDPNVITDRVIDLHTFTTAVKVGFGEGVHELKFDSWRIQQEVPAHHRDTDGIFGTQIMKLIIADIDPNLEYSGIKGSELIKEYEELIIADINRSYNKILGELEVRNEAGVLDRKATFDKLVKRLQIEVINRGLGEEYLEGLDQPNKETYSEALDFIQDTNLPLWHPLHSYRIEALMNSMFKKEITKQKFSNGFVFTNVSPYGFERQPKIKFKNDNSIDYFEVYAPIYDKRLEKYIDTKTGTITDVEQIPSDLLEGIVYRIPTEDKYSMFRIKVIGFLPADAGVIVMPNEVTKIAGLDYDIDSVKGFFKGLPPKGLREQLQKQLDTLKEINPDDPSIPKLQEQIDNIVNDAKFESDKRKIELMESVLRSEHMTETILTPGGYDQIVENNYYIRWSKNNKVKAKHPKYEDFKALDNRKKEELLSTTTPYYSPLLQVEMARRMNTGKALIGGAAVNNVVHSMFQRAKDALNLKYPFKFLGKEFTDLTRTKDENGQNISKNFASLLAAFVDNGKDPQAEYFNMNQFTAPVAYVMDHLGIPLDVIQKFLAAKSIELYTRNLENEGGKEKRLRDKNKYPLYHRMELNKLKVNSETENISAQELDTALTAEEDTELGQKMLKNFLIYKKIASKVQSFVTAAKLGDQGAGPTQAANIIKLRNIYKDIKDGIYKDHESIVTGAINFLSTPSFMTEFVKKGIQDVNSWIIEHGGFPDLTNSYLGDILSRFEGIKGYEIDETELRNFYEGYIEFIANGHPDFKYDQKRLEATEKRVEASKHKNIRILDYMVKEDKGLSFRAPIGTDSSEIQLIRNSWKKLHELDPELSRDLAYYAFQRDGFSVSLGSFTQYQPAFIYIDNKGFTEYLRKEIASLSSTDLVVKQNLEIFKDQFIRNNYEELSYVPVVEKPLAFENNKDGLTIGMLLSGTYYANEDGFYPFVKLPNKTKDGYVLFKYLSGTNGIYIYSSELAGMYDPTTPSPSNPAVEVRNTVDVGEVIGKLEVMNKINDIFQEKRKVLNDKWNIFTLKQLKEAADRDPDFLRRIEEC